MENTILPELITVRKGATWSDMITYLSIIISEGLFVWLWYVFVMKLGDWRGFRLFIIEYDKEIIGGLCTTGFPLAKYKPYNWFNPKARAKVDELRRAGYLGAGCFIVMRRFRNRGIGATIFRCAYTNQKVYFTSSPAARKLYLRNGAKIVYESTYDIFVYEE